MGIRETDPTPQLSLPPGFRFYPTDEELLVQYLCRKIAGHCFSQPIIGDIDLYKFDPWDLPNKALFGEKEWYFFSPRDRKYPNGSRPNRVAGSGYWKATGTDKIITTEGRKVGIKKSLVFYVGKAPKGIKTNWIMHEYKVSEPPRKNGSIKLDEWVLCRIYVKNSSGQNKEYSHATSSSSSSPHQYDDVLESLPEIKDPFFSLPIMDSLHQQEDQKLTNLPRLGSGDFDWATLAWLNPDTLQAQQGLAHLGNANIINNINMGSENEVQSWAGNQRVSNSVFFPTNLTEFTQGISGSVDPFGVGYPVGV